MLTSSTSCFRNHVQNLLPSFSSQLKLPMSTAQSAKRTSYFGTKVSVAFDDGKEYTEVIVGRNEYGQWITRFEDGTEDTCL